MDSEPSYDKVTFSDEQFKKLDQVKIYKPLPSFPYILFHISYLEI